MKRIITICTLLLLSVSLSTAQWTNNQNASQVIGQSDYTSYGSGSGLNQLYRPYDVVIDAANSKAYVVEYNNYRVLRFAYPFTGTPPTAEMQFGTGSSATAKNAFSSPVSAAVYNNVLYVAELNAHRILRFNSASTRTNSPNADGIIGQSDYVSTTAGTSSTKLDGSYQIFIDGSGNLWVADGNNNRVLKFSNVNSKATDGTAAADLVLGQSSMNTNTPSGSPPASTDMYNPTGVCMSGTTVWVADQSNYRVLRFDNPTTNGVAANGVLGQTSLTTRAADGSTCSQSTFTGPNYVQVDGNGNLYLTDQNRLVIFLNAASKTNGGNADNVLGESNWTSSTSHAGTTGFTIPLGLAIDNTNNKLFVADMSNNRILGFTASSALPVELSSFTAAASKGNVDLAWSTATEVNNYGFEIERRAISTSTWQKISFVAGNGTSNALHRYSYVDQPMVGTYAYRLKQINNGGIFKYSQEMEVTIEAPKVFALCQNYPNPFNPTTTISFDLPSKSFVSLKVYDIMGREVATVVSEEMSAGSYTKQWIATNMSSGVYFYRLQTGNFTETKKLFLLK